MRRPGAGGVCRDLCRTNTLAPLHASAHRAAPRHQQISCLAANWIFYFLSKPIDICHHHKTIIKIIKEQRWTTDGSVSVQSRDTRCKVALICDSHVHGKFPNNPNPAASAHTGDSAEFAMVSGHFMDILGQKCMILLPFHVILRGQTFIIEANNKQYM